MTPERARLRVAWLDLVWAICKTPPMIWLLRRVRQKRRINAFPD